MKHKLTLMRTFAEVGGLLIIISPYLTMSSASNAPQSAITDFDTAVITCSFQFLRQYKKIEISRSKMNNY